MPDERVDQLLGFDRGWNGERRRSRDSLGPSLVGTPVSDPRAAEFSQRLESRIPDLRSQPHDYNGVLPDEYGLDDGQYLSMGAGYGYPEQRTVPQSATGASQDSFTSALPSARHLLPSTLSVDVRANYHYGDSSFHPSSQTAGRSPWSSPSHQRSASETPSPLYNDQFGMEASTWGPLPSGSQGGPRAPTHLTSDPRDTTGLGYSSNNAPNRGVRRPETWSGVVTTGSPLGIQTSVPSQDLLSRGGSAPWTSTLVDDLQHRSPSSQLEYQMMVREALFLQHQQRRLDPRNPINQGGSIQHHPHFQPPGGARTPFQQPQASPRGYFPGRVPSRQPSYGDELRRVSSFPDAELASGRHSGPNTPNSARTYGGRRTPPAQDLRIRASRTASGSYDRTSSVSAQGPAWDDPSHGDGLYMHPVGPIFSRPNSALQSPQAPQGNSRHFQQQVSQGRDLELDARMAAAVVAGRWPSDGTLSYQNAPSSGRPSPTPLSFHARSRSGQWEDSPGASPLDVTPPEVSPRIMPKGPGFGIGGPSRKSPDLPTTQRFDLSSVTDAEEFFPSPRSPGECSVVEVGQSNRSSPGRGTYTAQSSSDRTVDAAARMLEALSLRSLGVTGGAYDAVNARTASLVPWKFAGDGAELESPAETAPQGSSLMSTESTAVPSPSMDTLPLTPPSEAATEAGTRAATPSGKQTGSAKTTSTAVAQLTQGLIRKFLRYVQYTTSDLRSCALVNKSFSSAAIPLLWRRVSFGSERITRRVLDALERRVQAQQVPPCVFTKQLEIIGGMSDQVLASINLIMRMAGGGPRVVGQGMSGLKELTLWCPPLIDAYVLLRMFDGAAPMAMEALKLRGPGCGEKMCAVVAMWCRKVKKLEIEEGEVTDNSMGTIFQQLAQLRSLTLRRCPRIGNGVLNALSIYTKDLEEFTIDLSPPTVSGQGPYPPLVPGSISDEGFIQLVRNCRKIRVFRIVDCDIGDQGLEILASSCRDLEVVELVATDRTDHVYGQSMGLHAAAGGMTYPLPGMQMDMQRGSDVGFIQFVPMRSLADRSLNHLFRTCQLLRRFRLSSRYLPHGVPHHSLARLTQNCPRLEALDLSGSRVPQKVLQTTFASAVAWGSGVNQLANVAGISSLPANVLMQSGTTMGLGASAGTLTGGLKYILLHDCPEVDDQVLLEIGRSCPNLIAVSLGRTVQQPLSSPHHPRFTDRGIEALILGCGPRLRALDLSRTNVSSLEIISKLCISLDVLNVEGCRSLDVQEVMRMATRQKGRCDVIGLERGKADVLVGEFRDKNTEFVEGLYWDGWKIVSKGGSKVWEQ
ncbi:hypothetical protein HDU93_007796 [Gonapodya sp. JEL0774]|nr:hypothetical protein HDU93_007796 [Gonapodya sp. JEL0774]